jgi:hypothetical protein
MGYVSESYYLSLWQRETSSRSLVATNLFMGIAVPFTATKENPAKIQCMADPTDLYSPE